MYYSPDGVAQLADEREAALDDSTHLKQQLQNLADAKAAARRRETAAEQGVVAARQQLAEERRRDEVQAEELCGTDAQLDAHVNTIMGNEEQLEEKDGRIAALERQLAVERRSAAEVEAARDALAQQVDELRDSLTVLVGKFKAVSKEGAAGRA